MADNKKQGSTTSKKTETKFSVEDILKSPQVFGTSSYILEGALHGKGSEFTKKEVEKLTDEFMKREVK